MVLVIFPVVVVSIIIPEIKLQVIGDFELALIPTAIRLADLTITLTVTATLARDGTEYAIDGNYVPQN